MTARAYRLAIAGAAAPIAVLSLVTGAAAGNAVPTSHSLDRASCAQVLMLGARGSGEKPADSVGTRVTALFSQLASDVRGKLTTTTVALTKSQGYKAYSVGGYLIPPTAVGVVRYTRGMDAGIPLAIDDLVSAAKRCPEQQFVLGGYSQGAIVMHQVVNRLAEQNRTGILKRIAGVALIADGDRVRHTRTHIIGSAPAAGEGIRPWAHVPLHHRDVTPAVAGRTYSVCVRYDLICDTSGHWIKGIGIHLGKQYEKGSLLIKTTAHDIAGNLTKPKSSIPSTWPVHSQEGPPALWAWFGASFEYPDWVSCTDAVDYCIAGIGSDVHIMQIHGIADLGTIPLRTDSPYDELTGAGFTPAQAQQLLEPS